MYHLPAPQGTFMLLTPLPFPGNRGAQRAGDNRAFMDIGKTFFPSEKVTIHVTSCGNQRWETRAGF